MPEMDGYETTSIVRSSESAVLDHSIPIIAMIANVMKRDRERCIEAGMDDYIPKPINSQVLVEMIEKWISEPDESLPFEQPIDGMPEKDIFDKTGLLDRMMGDNDLAKGFLDVFLEDIPCRIVALKEVLDNGNAPGIQLQEHTIKGAEGHIGASLLREAALQVEKAGKAADMSKAASLVKEIEKQLEILKRTLIELELADSKEEQTTRQ